MAIAVSGAVFYLIYVPANFRDNKPIEIAVQNGQSVYGIAQTLQERGLIVSQNIFVFYVQGIGQEKNLKSGKYILSRSLSLSVIVDIMAKGLSEPEDILVTIPEGFNVWEIDKRFVASGLIKIGQISRAYQHKEGHLFPDTYRFKKETFPEDIINKMEQNYFLKSQTKSDITLIIASLLEMEAKTKDDMELISGIIAKRLERGIQLQIDASVGYGWCLKKTAQPTFKGQCDVTQAPIATEIKIDGPYNTYARNGLPQGAISNPGLTALEAAANPRPSDYLYYLSTRDGSQIIYAKTSAEQAANRLKYLGI